MSSFIDSIASLLSLGDQDANVSNFGFSTANTGHNDVTGNDSDNSATSSQQASAGGIFGPGDDATAANSSSNRNLSDGTALLATGNASAIGNVAETNIFQSAPSFGAGGGIYIGDQEANVYNYGDASANTGHNDVTGNDSTNTATSHQDASAGGIFGPGDDASAVNSSANTNMSDGTAVLHTGNASAVGNVAETNIFQSGPSFGSGGGIYIGDQEANVYNSGSANADTGHNTVTGNDSTNTATSHQDASAGGIFGPGDDATAVNSSANTNMSDGTAVLETGNASAVGNVAETNIHQSAPSFGSGGGIYIGDQEANVYNSGTATADTGHNTVTGNDSHNTADSFQDADAGGVFGPGDDATAVNSSSNTNMSDGHAAAHTGDAHAVGNVAHTDIAQEADDDMDFDFDF
ncbi:MAG TPA: hypothetical protein VMZ22_03260 [Acidimicrobiales bacterium]|nr:hypothetical protein [Acidimicrobiales bacterium]